MPQKKGKELNLPPLSYNQMGPLPMQLVVPSAVRAAVAAAMMMRSSTSQTPFFFILHLLSSLLFYLLPFPYSPGAGVFS